MKKIFLLLLFISIFIQLGFSQAIVERFPDKESAAKAGYSMQRRDCAPGEKELRGAYGTAPHDMLVFKYVKENEPAANEPEEVVHPVVEAVQEEAASSATENLDDTTERSLPSPIVEEEMANESSLDIVTISIYVGLGILFLLVLFLLFWVWRLYHMYQDKLTELENEIYRIQKNPAKVDVAPQVKSELQRQMMSNDFERTVATIVRHTVENLRAVRHPRTTPQQEAVIDQLMQSRSALPPQEQMIQPQYQPQIQPSYQQPVAPSEKSPAEPVSEAQDVEDEHAGNDL